LEGVELAPGNLHAACTLATILIRRERWEDAAVQARRFLAAGSEAFPTEIWDDTITFFREAVAAQRAGEAVALLDELGLGDRWLPLREALAAADAGTPKYLRRVAPEVRRPAEEILAMLQPEASSGGQRATSKSSRTSKGSRGSRQERLKKLPGDGKSSPGRFRR
jgi:hypothetical protein